MVDLLNPSNRPAQPADLSATTQRLESLLSQGQPRTAQVIQSMPLPAATINSALTNAASANPMAGQSVIPAPLPTPAAAGHPNVAPVTAAAITTANSTNPAAPSASPAATLQSESAKAVIQPPAPSKADLYKIQFRLEGRLFELLTSKPLDPGTLIQISRGGDNKILLQQLPAANAGAGTSKPNLASITGQTSLGRNEAPMPASNSQAALNVRPSPPVNTAVERLPILPLKTEIALRIAPGERLNAEVLSSRVQALPATAQSSSTAASTTFTITGPQAAQQTNAANTDSRSYQIRIDLQQGQKIELTSPRPLPPGTQVQLVRDNQGQLWAELPTVKTRAIEQALREHLPQQQTPAALLNLLSGAQANGQLQQAKPLLLNLFQLLLGRSLTSPLQTDAASIKQQVQNSGSLLENKLALGNTQQINQDHKAILLKITQQLGQATNPRELPAMLSERISALTQQALSRVLVNQITSLGNPTQEQGNEQSRTLALDIPILWQNKTENLQLKIQREEREDDAKMEDRHYRWQVRLSFDVDQNKILQADLTLEADQISVIWSGDPELRQRIESQLDQLQQRLESVGLKIKTLGVREQLADNQSTPQPPRRQLIDINT
mgnify:FL=1